MASSSPISTIGTRRSQVLRWVLPAVMLASVGCSATGARRVSRPTSDPVEAEGRGSTMATDLSTVEPGRTVAPPSLGVDLN